MTISVRLSEEDTNIIKAYAAMNNISLSDLVRNAIMEKIENESQPKNLFYGRGKKGVGTLSEIQSSFFGKCFKEIKKIR